MSDLFSVSVGEGLLILTMHGGLGLDHSYMAPHFDPLQEFGQVVYYDHRGNGKSPDPEDFAMLSIENLVEDAATLAASYSDAPFVLIGHSYGGFIAQQFAITYPERLKGLGLLSTVPAFDYAPQLAGTDAQMAALGKAFSQPMTSDAEWRETWNTLSQMYWAEFDADRAAAIDAATTYSYEAWNQGSANLATFNTLEGLAGLNVPTLVISGAQDGITPPGPGAERIAATIPGAQLSVIEGAAHFVFIEDGGNTIAQIGSFIAALD